MSVTNENVYTLSKWNVLKSVYGRCERWSISSKQKNLMYPQKKIYCEIREVPAGIFNLSRETNILGKYRKQLYERIK